MKSKHIITAAAIFAMLLSAAQTASAQTVKYFDGMFPFGINNAGKIVGLGVVGSTNRGVVIDSLTGEVTVPPDPGPINHKEAFTGFMKISNNGRIVGNVGAYFNNRFDKEGMRLLKYQTGMLGDIDRLKLFKLHDVIYTTLMGVNDNGDVIGYYVSQTSNGAQAFFQPARGSPQDIFIEGLGPAVRDLNDNGDVVASLGRPASRGFILRRDGSLSEVFVPVANLLRFDLNGINNRGDVVGTFEVNDPVRGQQLQGFAMVGGQFRVIDMGPHTQLMDINDLGEIVGTGERDVFVIYPDLVLSSTGIIIPHVFSFPK